MTTLQIDTPESPKISLFYSTIPGGWTVRLILVECKGSGLSYLPGDLTISRECKGPGLSYLPEDLTNTDFFSQYSSYVTSNT